MNESNNFDKMNGELDNLSQGGGNSVEEIFKQAKKEIDKFLVISSGIASESTMNRYISHIDNLCEKLYPGEMFKILRKGENDITWQDIWNIGFIKLDIADETERVSLLCDVLFDIISVYKGNSPKGKGIFSIEGMFEETTPSTNKGIQALIRKLFKIPIQEKQEIYSLRGGYIVHNLEDILYEYKKLKHNLEHCEMYLPMTLDIEIKKVQEGNNNRDKYTTKSNEDGNDIIKGVVKDVIEENNKPLYLIMKSAYPYLSLKMILHRKDFFKYFSIKINKENGRTYRSVYDQYKLYQELSEGSLVRERTLINEIFAEDFMCYNATAYLFDGFSRLFQPFVEKYTKEEERIDVKALFEKYKYYPGQEIDIELLQDFPELTQIFLLYVIFYTEQYISIRYPILRIRECQKFAECLKKFEQSISKGNNDTKRKQILEYLNGNGTSFRQYIKNCVIEYEKKLVYISKMVYENIYLYNRDAFGTISEQSKSAEDLLKECGKDGLSILKVSTPPHQDSRYEILFKMKKKGNDEKSTKNEEENNEKLPRNKYKSLSNIILTKAIQCNSCNYSIYNRYMDTLNSEEYIVYNGKVMKRK